MFLLNQLETLNFLDHPEWFIEKPYHRFPRNPSQITQRAIHIETLVFFSKPSDMIHRKFDCIVFLKSYESQTILTQLFPSWPWTSDSLFISAWPHNAQSLSQPSRDVSNFIWKHISRLSSLFRYEALSFILFLKGTIFLVHITDIIFVFHLGVTCSYFLNFLMDSSCLCLYSS
jgi:hypothetical protein